MIISFGREIDSKDEAYMMAVVVVVAVMFFSTSLLAMAGEAGSGNVPLFLAR